MDPKKEQEFTEKISGLETKVDGLVKTVTEFTEKATAAAEELNKKKIAADTEAADSALRSEIKQFCMENGLTTKLHEDMHLQELMFHVAKTQATVEFGEKKLSLSDLLKDVVKAMKPGAPKGTADFSEDPNGKGSAVNVMEFAEQYVTDHPQEFSGKSRKKAVGEVLNMVISGTLKVTNPKK